LGSIGVGFGFEVGAAPSTGVGFGFGKPLREELAGEGVVCAFTTASSRFFLNSSAAFLSCCFCKKNTPPRPRKITTKMVFLITENRRTMSHTLRAVDSVFQHRTDNFFRLAPAGDSSLKLLLRNNFGGGHLNMKTQIPNINRVRSAWRRVKEDIKDAIIRDLKPVKDVKGGVLRANPNPPQAGGRHRRPLTR
jgi:hypothetical protein